VNPRLRRGMKAGFTLIELMVVVAIIGVLASVAIPAFMKYVLKAKTTEALGNVRRMFEGARAYFHQDWTARGTAGLPLARQFPATAAYTPVLRCCQGGSGGKCRPDSTIWTNAWMDLKFAMEDAHYFNYDYTSSGTNLTSAFSADAFGDFDCDNIWSTYEMIGSVLPDGTIPSPSGAGGFFTNNQLE